MQPARAAQTRPQHSLRRVALLGALTAFPSGLVIAAIYYLRNVAQPAMQDGWSWGLWTLAMAVAIPIIGGLWAAGASWGVRRATKRAGTPAIDGFFGGWLGGLIPMAISIGGFGAFSVPYVGTALIGFGVLLSFSLFATLHDMEPEPGRPQPSWRARALASVLVVVPFGLAAMATVALVFPWSTLVVIREFLAANTSGWGASTTVWAVITAPFMGGILGALLGLVTSLSRIFAAVPRLAR